MPNPLIILTLALGLTLVGCSKKTPPPEPTQTPPPATAATPVEPTAAPEATDSELDNKKKAMEFALKEDAIKNDPKGQWAIKATASSSFASDLNDLQAGYHPMQATGAPNVASYSDDSNSWASKDPDTGIEWLEVEYAKAVNASEIRIRQSHAPGAIVKVEAFDETGTARTVWSGPDTTSYPSNQISWLNVPIQPGTLKTQKIKITLATNMISGWNEIDAVQLIGE
ncbi:MAG TPA: hypothetical protein PK129_09025 [Cellvibrionaceae bacterium]|nr:hypothetical protein [Cellvibrionaceae bacterium]